MDSIIGLIIIIIFVAWLRRRKKHRRIFPERKQRPQLSNWKAGKRMDYERVYFQALETIYIIEHSTNVETVSGRLTFLHDLLAEIEFVQSISQAHYLAPAIAKYEQAYYDRPISQLQMKVIESAAALLDNWREFTEECMYDCVKRYAISQDPYIDELKTSKGKQNRILKIAEIVDELKTSINSEQVKNRLDSLKTELLNKVSNL